MRRRQKAVSNPASTKFKYKFKKLRDQNPDSQRQSFTCRNEAKTMDGRVKKLDQVETAYLAQMDSAESLLDIIRANQEDVTVNQVRHEKADLL